MISRAFTILLLVPMPEMKVVIIVLYIPIFLYIVLYVLLYMLKFNDIPVLN